MSKSGIVHESFIDYEKAYDSVKREVSYYILIDYCTTLNLGRLINVSKRNL